MSLDPFILSFVGNCLRNCPIVFGPRACLWGARCNRIEAGRIAGCQEKARLQCNLPDCIHHRVAAMLMIWGTCVTCANLATRTHTWSPQSCPHIYFCLCILSFVLFFSGFRTIFGQDLHLLIARNGAPNGEPSIRPPLQLENVFSARTRNKLHKKPETS